MNTKTFTDKWDREEKLNEGGVIGGISSYGNKSDIYKKWWFWVIVLIIVFLLYWFFS